jgi:hypothetical protein
MHNVWTAHEAARHLATPAWVERMVDAFLALKLRGPKLYRALAQELPRVERLSVTVRLKKASVEALTPFFVERRAELRLPAPRAAYAFVQIMASLTEAAVLEGEGVLSDRAHRELLVDVLRRALCP